jgi:putative phage-type endonuclease
MEQHDLVQGSDEWKAYRAEHFNASDVPAMLGISPYTTRTELMRFMATGIAEEVDEETQRRFDEGHRREALARPLAEEIIGKKLYPVVGSLGVYSASFDGITMDETICFEHKSLNNDLREMFATDSPLPELYTSQMEQQLMVSGAEKCLFMATEWDQFGNFVDGGHRWYESDPKMRERIIAGWTQFEDDLEGYQYVEPAAEAVGRAPETLPALHIEVTGMVTNSNLAEFKEASLSVFKSINRELKTDQDFANAEKTVKWCGEVEKRLDAAKEHALGQTKSIDELFRTIDEVKEESRTVRLELDKLVKERKKAIRIEILQEGQTDFYNHVARLEKSFDQEVSLPSVDIDIAGAMKGRSKVSSLRSAMSDEVARAKVVINQIAEKIKINLETMKTHTSGYEFLFSDIQLLIQKENEDLQNVIKLRIAEHKEAEEKRLEEERERIRQEEEEKAKAKVQEAEKEAGTKPETASEQKMTVRMYTPSESNEDEKATLNLTEIGRRLGFTLSAAFIENTLGIKPAEKQRKSVLYRESDWLRICDAMVTHIHNCSTINL